jgi:hypothetical protein
MQAMRPPNQRPTTARPASEAGSKPPVRRSEAAGVPHGIALLDAIEQPPAMAREGRTPRHGGEDALIPELPARWRIG